MRVAHVHHPKIDPEGMYQIKPLHDTRLVDLKDSYVDWHTVTVISAQYTGSGLVTFHFQLNGQLQYGVATLKQYLTQKSETDADITK